MQLGVILGLIFGLVIAFFAILNTEVVTFNYYFGQVRTSIALLVLSSAALGALAVGFLGFLKQIRTGFTLWDYQNKVQRLGKEVEELKNQKKALADDLSFLQRECENAIRGKEAELMRQREGQDARAENAAHDIEEITEEH